MKASVPNKYAMEHPAVVAAIESMAKVASDISVQYEELRQAIDGGSESMTHEDAIKAVKYWQAEIEGLGKVLRKMTEALTLATAEWNALARTKLSDKDAFERICQERDALRTDAERYRWLREQDDQSPVFCMYGSNGQWGECGHSDIYGDLLDESVDEAMLTAAKEN